MAKVGPHDEPLGTPRRTDSSESATDADTNADDELVPVKGTRAQLVERVRDTFATYMPHIAPHRISKQMRDRNIATFTPIKEVRAHPRVVVARFDFVLAGGHPDGFLGAV